MSSDNAKTARKVADDLAHQEGRCERDCPHCGPECRECGGDDGAHEQGCERSS